MKLGIHQRHYFDIQDPVTLNNFGEFINYEETFNYHMSIINAYKHL